MGADMFLAVHAAVGALAGNAVGHPSSALVLGLVSHFFLDMVPHGDEKLYHGFNNGQRFKPVLYVALDAAVTVILIAVFFLRQDFFSPVNVSLGVVGGLLPDLLVGLSKIFKPRKNRGLVWRLARFEQFHMRNHHFLIKRLRRLERDIPLYSGIMFQAILLFVLVKLIL